MARIGAVRHKVANFQDWKGNMANFKALGKRIEMKPSGNPDHSIIPRGNKIEKIAY